MYFHQLHSLVFTCGFSKSACGHSGSRSRHECHPFELRKHCKGAANSDKEQYNSSQSKLEKKEEVSDDLEFLEMPVPSLVAIESKHTNGDPWSLVGHGMILKEDTILTTASIVEAIETDIPSELYTLKNLRVIAGTTNRLIHGPNLQVAGICAMSVSRSHDIDDVTAEFALLHLNKTFKAKDGTDLAKLASGNVSAPQNCKYVSWGKANNGVGSMMYRQEAAQAWVKIRPPNDCRARPPMFCTSPASCGFLDSGAPLVCSDGSGPSIYGLSEGSYDNVNGIPSRSCTEDSIFMDTQKLDLAWVENERKKARFLCGNGNGH